ncbi:MAG TPA: hypothetical protein DD734_08195 [Firmicutes bacterium]|nr:hypothetical protein [Bacillota bacterium]HBR34600.1 hypothetical protein [Bacillota bacterium]
MYLHLTTLFFLCSPFLVKFKPRTINPNAKSFAKNFIDGFRNLCEKRKVFTTASGIKYKIFT